MHVALILSELELKFDFYNLRYANELLCNISESPLGYKWT